MGSQGCTGVRRAPVHLVEAGLAMCRAVHAPGAAEHMAAVLEGALRWHPRSETLLIKWLPLWCQTEIKAQNKHDYLGLWRMVSVICLSSLHGSSSPLPCHKGSSAYDLPGTSEPRAAICILCAGEKHRACPYSSLKSCGSSPMLLVLNRLEGCTCRSASRFLAAQSCGACSWTGCCMTTRTSALTPRLTPASCSWRSRSMGVLCRCANTGMLS